MLYTYCVSVNILIFPSTSPYLHRHTYTHHIHMALEKIMERISHWSLNNYFPADKRKNVMKSWHEITIELAKAYHACLFCNQFFCIVNLLRTASNDESLLAWVTWRPTVKFTMCTGLLVDATNSFTSWSNRPVSINQKSNNE